MGRDPRKENWVRHTEAPPRSSNLVEGGILAPEQESPELALELPEHTQTTITHTAQ